MMTLFNKEPRIAIIFTPQSRVQSHVGIPQSEYLLLQQQQNARFISCDSASAPNPFRVSNLSILPNSRLSQDLGLLLWDNFKGL